MRPEGEAADDRPPVDEMEISVMVRVDDERGASATQRRAAGRDVVTKSVAGDVVGILYRPADATGAPGVVVLHGSGGRPMHPVARASADYWPATLDTLEAGRET